MQREAPRQRNSRVSGYLATLKSLGSEILGCHIYPKRHLVMPSLVPVGWEACVSLPYAGSGQEGRWSSLVLLVTVTFAISVSAG